MLNLECDDLQTAGEVKNRLGAWGILLSGYPGTRVLKGKGIPDLDGVANTAQERPLRNLHPTTVAPGPVSCFPDAHVSEKSQPGCSELSFKELKGDSEGSSCIVL